MIIILKADLPNGKTEEAKLILRKKELKNQLKELIYLKKKIKILKKNKLSLKIYLKMK